MELVTGILFCMVVAIAGSNGNVELTAQCSKIDGVEQQPEKIVQIHLPAITVPQMNEPHGADSWSMMNELLVKRPVEFICPDYESLPENVKRQDRIDQPMSCMAWTVPASTPIPNAKPTLDVGMAMLTVGLAQFNEATANVLSPQERGQYSFAQEEARAKKVGIWQSQ